jgi:hypothetical protein
LQFGSGSGAVGPYISERHYFAEGWRERRGRDFRDGGSIFLELGSRFRRRLGVDFERDEDAMHLAARADALDDFLA